MNSLEMTAILPIAMLVISGILCMLMGTARKETAAAWCNTVSLLGLAAAAGVISTQRHHVGLAYTDALSSDPFTSYFQLIFLVIIALVGLASREYLWREAIPVGEYYALLLFAGSGMCLMAAANDLMVIFIGLEISSLSSYVLVGLRRTEAASSESSLKYFLLGSFATAFFLYGVALLFGVTGTTKLSAIRTYLYGGQNAVPAAFHPHGALPGGATIVPAQFGFAGSMDLLLGAAIALMFVGLAFKVSAAPFQAWTPDVYQGAPSPVAAMLSTAPKAAAFAAFLRIFMVSLGASTPLWSNAMWMVALLTMTVGNFAALWQTDVKRLLAYSSIAHAGYILVAFSAASTDAVAAILFYLAAYAFMNIGAFVIVMHVAGLREQNTDLRDFAGLGFRAPVVAGLLTIFVLSLLGIPLTAGFLGKFYIFRAAVQSNLLLLTVLGALNSAVGAYYYLKILVAMYMVQPAEDAPSLSRVPSGILTVATICAIATVVIGVYPQPVLRLATQAAQWLPQL
jgi:NADH-quinone oxidoreductase subunit N